MKAVKENKTIYKTIHYYNDDDYRQEIQGILENYPEWLEEENKTEEEVISEMLRAVPSKISAKIYEMMAENSDISFEDERANLNREMETRLIAIVDLGRWNGRFPAYKELGYNLNEILQSFGGEDIHVYLDAKDKDIKIEAPHHDSTNYITVRRWRKNISDERREDILGDYYTSKPDAKTKLFNATASIAGDVAAIYGW